MSCETGKRNVAVLKVGMHAMCAHTRAYKEILPDEWGEGRSASSLVRQHLLHGRMLYACVQEGRAAQPCGINAIHPGAMPSPTHPVAGDNTGKIIGGVVGGVLSFFFLIVLPITIYFYIRKRKLDTSARSRGGKVQPVDDEGENFHQKAIFPLRSSPWLIKVRISIKRLFFPSRSSPWMMKVRIAIKMPFSPQGPFEGYNLFSLDLLDCFGLFKPVFFTALAGSVSAQHNLFKAPRQCTQPLPLNYPY